MEEGRDDGRPQVFISYARESSRREAEQLHQVLSETRVRTFLDTEGVAQGESIPQRVFEGLLGARVIVVLAEGAYFTRRYCAEELATAVAAYRARLRRGGSPEALEEALSPIVLGLSVTGERLRELERLPPELWSINWPLASDSVRLADLVQLRLGRVSATVGERLERLGELAGLRGRLHEALQMPVPRSLRGVRLYHESGVPPSIGDAFVGRARELWELHTILTTGRAGSGTAALTTAVEGGGGFGKTRLALEYLHRYGTREYPGGLFWVNADVPEDRLKAQLHGILCLLKPATPSLEILGQRGVDVSRELGTTLHGLGPQERVLYVVDNVPEPGPGTLPEPLSKWCPAEAEIALLVTSRARQSLAPGIRRLEVRELEPEPAVALLTYEFGGRRELSEESWQYIARWVGEWPLALGLLNAVLRGGAVGARELFEASQAAQAGPVRELDRHVEAVRGAVPEGVLRGATEALQVSYGRLSEQAQRAARLLAWLSPDPIPVAVVSALNDEQIPPDVRLLLHARSFVTAVTGADVEMYGRMHRVLADFLRCEEEDPEAELESVCVALLTVMEAGGPKTWPLMRACRPHAEMVFSQAKILPFSAPATEKFVFLGLTIGRILLVVEGQEEGSAEIVRTCLELALRELGEEHPTTLAAMHCMALTQYTLGWRDPLSAELGRARGLEERVLEAYRRELGEEDNSETLKVMDLLALTLWRLGELDKAQALQERLLEGRRQLLGEDHPETGRAMTNLTAILAEQREVLTRAARAAEEAGRQGEALATIEKAAGIARELAKVNPDSYLFDLASSLNALAIGLQTAGRGNEGLVTSQEAVAIYRELAKTNPETYLSHLALSLNLSAGLGEQERGDGLAASREAVAIYRELAKADPDVYLSDLASSLNLLAGLEAMRRGDGLAPSQEAVAIYRELAKANPDTYLPELAVSLNNLSAWLNEAGRGEGLAASQEAVAIYRELARATFDPYLFDLALSLENLSAGLEEAARRGEGLTASQEAVAIYRRLAKANPDPYLSHLARSLVNLSAGLGKASRRGEAQAAIDEAVMRYRRLAAANPDALREELAYALELRDWVLGDPE